MSTQRVIGRVVGDAAAGATMVGPLFHFSRGRGWTSTTVSGMPRRIIPTVREAEQRARSYLIQLRTGWRVPGMEASLSSLESLSLTLQSKIFSWPYTTRNGRDNACPVPRPSLYDCRKKIIALINML